MALALLGCGEPCDRGEPRFDLEHLDRERTLFSGLNTLRVRSGGRGITARRLAGWVFPDEPELLFFTPLGEATCDGEHWIEVVEVEIDRFTNRCLHAEVELSYDDAGEPTQIRLKRGLPVQETYAEAWELCL